VETGLRPYPAFVGTWILSRLGFASGTNSGTLCGQRRFFLEQIQESTVRLRNFVEQASKATLSGDIFDDAATGQGLLNFFFRALNSGAIDPVDVENAGVTVEEVQAGSFRKIVEARRI
jgi:hypothetical protein